MTDAPKLFISYSWTSQDHQEWVINLATDLRTAGIDVVLDRWDLREGHDAYQFMEQMVSSSDIKKVVIVCDKAYSEKADQRHGGVGAETQIISPEIYSKQQQDKFVVAVAERDEQGKPYLPTYYKSRIYIDLSDAATFASNLEQLVRWAFDKPLYVKPPLGLKPAFLDGADFPILPTAFSFKRAVDAIRNDKSYRRGAVGEYFECLASSFEGLRILDPSGDIDDRVIASIEAFLPYRNEAIEVFLTLAQHGFLADEQRAVHRLFERLHPFMHRLPEAMTPWRESDFDNYRFIVHELFLFFIAACLSHERFDVVGNFLREPFIAQQDGGSSDEVGTFSVLRPDTDSLVRRNARLKLNRSSLRADLLKARAERTALTFAALMQADFVLFVRDCMDTLRDRERHQRWWPDTLVYAGYHRPFEIFSRAASGSYFDRLRVVFDMKEKGEFDQLLAAIGAQTLRVPQWNWHTVNVSVLLGYSKMATRP
jgi:hypothetical protein